MSEEKSFGFGFSEEEPKKEEPKKEEVKAEAPKVEKKAEKPAAKKKAAPKKKKEVDLSGLTGIARIRAKRANRGL